LLSKQLLAPIGNDAMTKTQLQKVVKLATLDRSKLPLIYVSGTLASYLYTEDVDNLLISKAADKKAYEALSKKLFIKARLVSVSQEVILKSLIPVIVLN